MNESPNQDEKSEVSSFLKECLSCHFIHKSRVPQCEQCGVIFSKWKDPLQKQAEMKLAKMAEEERKGLPVWLFISPILIIAAVLVLFFVPDVEVRILGPSLKYKLAPESRFNLTGRMQTEISDLSSNQKVSLTTSLEQQIRCLERDSGGNTVYKKIYSKLSIQGLPGFPSIIEKPGEEVGSWGLEKNLNPFGNEISGGVGGLTQAAKVNQHLNDLRNAQIQELQMRSSVFPRISGKTLDVEKEAQDAYIGNLLASLVPGNASIIDAGFPFEYPKGRLKKGSTISQNYSKTAHAGFLILNISKNISWKFIEAKRELGQFVISMDCDTPVSITLTPPNPIPGMDLQKISAQGFYKAKTTINYSDGFLEKLEGDLNITLMGPLEDAKALLEQYGIQTTTNDGQVLIHVKQIVYRSK